MNLPLSMVARLIGVNAKDFAEGWFEGRGRYKSTGNKAVIPGSSYQAGTVAFAASQAAVAFYIGMEKT